MLHDTRLLMGMPITVEIVDDSAPARMIEDVYRYFADVDQRFSTYKADSEVSRFNRGLLEQSELSPQFQEVLKIAAQTKIQTEGYFEIRRPDGSLDPSGIVKGWAIRNAAGLLHAAGIKNFFVDAGGDIESTGHNADGKDWTIGIRNPFNEQQIIKVLVPKGRGVATSGSYVRGQHIYNPFQPGQQIDDIVSLTVVGSDVLEADRFATAAFAMGKAGIHFIEEMPDLEGYIVAANGIATQTSGFKAFVTP